MSSQEFVKLWHGLVVPPEADMLKALESGAFAVMFYLNSRLNIKFSQLVLQFTLTPLTIRLQRASKSRLPNHLRKLPAHRRKRGRRAPLASDQSKSPIHICRESIYRRITLHHRRRTHERWPTRDDEYGTQGHTLFIGTMLRPNPTAKASTSLTAPVSHVIA